jgi:hypothetical protein
MRIRTDGEYEYRKEPIERAATKLDTNKTDAVVTSCDVVGTVLPALADALEEADIRPSQKQKLADAVSSRHVDFEIDTGSVSVQVD